MHSVCFSERTYTYQNTTSWFQWLFKYREFLALAFCHKTNCFHFTPLILIEPCYLQSLSVKSSPHLSSLNSAAADCQHYYWSWLLTCTEFQRHDPVTCCLLPTKFLRPIWQNNNIDYIFPQRCALNMQFFRLLAHHWQSHRLRSLRDKIVLVTL